MSLCFRFSPMLCFRFSPMLSHFQMGRREMLLCFRFSPMLSHFQMGRGEMLLCFRFSPMLSHFQMGRGEIDLKIAKNEKICSQIQSLCRIVFPDCKLASLRFGKYETKSNGRWSLMCYLKTREFSSLPPAYSKIKTTRRKRSSSVKSDKLKGKETERQGRARKSNKNKFKDSILTSRFFLLNKCWCLQEFKDIKDRNRIIFIFFFDKFGFLIWRGIFPWHAQIVLRRFSQNTFGNFYLLTFLMALLTSCHGNSTRPLLVALWANPLLE